MVSRRVDFYPHGEEKCYSNESRVSGAQGPGRTYLSGKTRSLEGVGTEPGHWWENRTQLSCLRVRHDVFPGQPGPQMADDIPGAWPIFKAYLAQSVMLM
jgi:hypothetical protein